MRTPRELLHEEVDQVPAISQQLQGTELIPHPQGFAQLVDVRQKFSQLEGFPVADSKVACVPFKTDFVR